MSRHLSTRNILSKSMHAFLLTLRYDRQTDKRTRATHLPPPLSEVNDYERAKRMDVSKRLRCFLTKDGILLVG